MSASDLLAAVLDQLPGSLRIDAETSRPGTWSRDEPDEAGATTTTSTHPGGLTALVSRTSHGNGAVEWRVRLRNDGAADSAVLSELRPLDLTWALPATEEAVLATTNGSLCELDDFLPWQRTVTAAAPVHLEPVGGRSSDGAMPFFTVTAGTTSLGVAIGWSGQWSVDLSRTGDGLVVQAGLAASRLRLHPDETITLPSILTVAVDGDADAAANAVRALVEARTPHGPGGRAATPLAHMTMSTFHVTHEVSQASELAAVRDAAELGLEAFWVDACWYGDTPLWSEQVGNWEVRTAAFPRGLRPVSDAAHEAGMSFVLWMEPERARAGTRLPSEHPGWFLPFPDAPDNLLLDLGDAGARAYVLELVSGYVEEFGVDVYRQDFNIRPLPAWRAADDPERQGIHEIRHVEGLYWLWDSLLERHPGLVIDNCASGGRRIDLETMRRSVPLWRSDSADVGGGAAGDDVPLANQVQVSGLSRYVGQHTGPIWAFDPYHVRSALSTGFVVYCPLPTDPGLRQDLASAVAEVQRLRPLLSGEFHSLLPPTLERDDWSASQFHRPAEGDGVAVVLRRPGSTEAGTRVALRDVEAGSRYRVTLSPGYRRGPVTELSGAELSDLHVSIADAPGAVLVEYERAR